MGPVIQTEGGETFPKRRRPFQVEENSRCKDPEAGMRLAYQGLKEAHVLEACVMQWTEQRLETRAGQGCAVFTDEGKGWVSL